MQALVGVREVEATVTGAAFARGVEDDFAAPGGGYIVATSRRRRRGQRELIGLQRRQLRADQIIRSLRNITAVRFSLNEP
jgi:hypothetical protein